VLLPDELVERPRPHAVGQRRAGAPPVSAGLVEEAGRVLRVWAVVRDGRMIADRPATLAPVLCCRKRTVGAMRHALAWLCIAGLPLAADAQVGFPSHPHAPIPNLSPVGVGDSVLVDANLVVWDVDVAFTLTHTWTGDLVVTLRSPQGVTVALLDRPGVPASTFGCSGDDPDIIADDEGAAGSIENDCQGGTGTAYVPGARYTPNVPLAAFDNQEALGYWTLHVADVAGAGDVGTFESWTLHLEGAVIPATDPGAGILGSTLEVWPNPTDGAGVVRLVLRDPGLVRVEIADALGRLIETLHDGPLGSGAHSMHFPDCPRGVYLVRAVVNGRAETVPVVVSR
jgi:subtilisin-like proprotein convertase family protein